MSRAPSLTVCAGIIAAITLAVLGYWFTARPDLARFPQAPPPPPRPTTETWPIYRGDPALAASTSTPIHDHLTLRWRFRTGDKIKSSPIIADNRVYIGSNDGHVYALDLLTGSPIWSFPEKQPSIPPTVEAPPFLFDNTLYIGFTDNILYALDPATGSLKWQYATDGKIVGSANASPPSTNHPAAILVGSYDNFLHAVDPHTGHPLWKTQTGYYVNGSPAVQDDLAVFGGCDGLIHTVQLHDGQALGTGLDLNAPIASSVALQDGTAYVGNYAGLFVAADVRNQKILWRFNAGSQGIYASPALSDDLVLVAAKDRTLYALDRSSGQPRWTFKARAGFESSPVICADRVVLGCDDGRIYLINLGNGSKIDEYALGAPIASSPAVASPWIIIGCDDGYVYAFSAETPEYQE